MSNMKYVFVDSTGRTMPVEGTSVLAVPAAWSDQDIIGFATVDNCLPEIPEGAFPVRLLGTFNNVADPSDDDQAQADEDTVEGMIECKQAINSYKHEIADEAIDVDIDVAVDEC